MSYDSSKLKEIWVKHIEVQERVLQLNSSPIEILPDSILKLGQKLRLKICETNKLDIVIDRITDFFSISKENIDKENGVLSCSPHNKYDMAQLLSLSQDCSKNYVHLSTRPILEGSIRSKKSTFLICSRFFEKLGVAYTLDSNRRIQVSVEALRELDNLSEFPKDILPETATGIFTMNPTPAYFLRKWMSIDCCHLVKREVHKYNGNNFLVWKKHIVLNNRYFSDDALDILEQKWGLRPHSYGVDFHISKIILENYDFNNSIIDFPEPKNGVFSFSFNHKEEKNNAIMLRNNWQVKLLCHIFDDTFGKENVTLSFRYLYVYDNQKYFNNFLSNIDYSEFYDDLRLKINSDDLSLSERNGSIGIDFKWREKTVDDLKEEICNNYDDLELSTFENHRCNIDISNKITNWEDIEGFLKDNFCSLKTFINHQNETLQFVQEYSSNEQATQFICSFRNSIPQLNNMGCDIEFHPSISNEKKYMCRIDSDGITENMMNVVSSLRGAEFSIFGHTFGKLINIRYPELLFDISSYDYNISEFTELESASIIPNLDGDIEKIARLRKAFDSIVNGKGVKNPNLHSFIFDASKATPTKDIDLFTNPQSCDYVEIKEHLLNKYINPPQLNAIIKCLKSKDISLIQGPPGTGKSTAIAELIWQHIRLNSKERLLLTSETNLAVDNAMDRTVNQFHNLVKPIRFGTNDKLASEGKQFSLEAMEQWVETGEFKISVDDSEDVYDETINYRQSDKLILINWMNNIKRRINPSLMDGDALIKWENYLSSPDQWLRNLFFYKYKKYCNVVGATCSSIGDYNTKKRATKFYMDYCTLFGTVTEKRIYNRNGDNCDDIDNDYNEPRTIKIPNSKDGINFTTVIQDESSKATPAELALPLIYGDKNIVIGDHRQLPPMLDKEEFKNTLDYLISNSKSVSDKNKIRQLKSYVMVHFDQMEISHFQRLYESIDESLKGEFTLQYRMHPDINEVIEQFYVQDKGLECGLTTPNNLGVDNLDVTYPFSRYHGISISDFICGESLNSNNHVIWIDVNSPEMVEGTSRVNDGEVKVIKHILKRFSQSSSFNEYLDKWDKDEDKEIGIISFYSKQRNRIRSMCKEFDSLPLKIDVVDRFQGMERNIILVSMVRSNCLISDIQQEADYETYKLTGFPAQNDLGFAQSPNRLNVALSRAKRLLIIIGNSQLFRQKNIYDNVYQTIEKNPNGKIIKCNPNEDID